MRLNLCVVVLVATAALSPAMAQTVTPTGSNTRTSSATPTPTRTGTASSLPTSTLVASTIPDANLVLWLRSEALSSSSSDCDGSGNVTVWPNSAPQADAFPFRHDAWPIFGYAPPNRFLDPTTRNCVARFTASQSTLLALPLLDLTSPSQSYTITIVARMRGPTRGRVMSSYHRTPFPVDPDWFLGWWNGRSGLAYAQGVLIPPFAYADQYRDSTSSDQWVMYTLTRDGSTTSSSGAAVTTLYKYGNFIASGGFIYGPRGLVLGGGVRNSEQERYGELSDCDVAEVIVHTSVLSLADRQQMEGALAFKHGFSHALPAMHPFYKPRRPAAAFTGLPQPYAWYRPEELPASGQLLSWPNAGSGGQSIDMRPDSGHAFLHMV